MRVIITFCIVLWLAKKIDQARLASRRKREKRILLEEKEAARIAKENHKLYLAANKLKKEQERERKAREKEREREEKLSAQKQFAGSELEYINHRLRQIDKLIELAEEKQSGTIYGGKEWLKAEREIMTLEKQAHVLHTKAQKARAVRAK